MQAYNVTSYPPARAFDWSKAPLGQPLLAVAGADSNSSEVTVQEAPWGASPAADRTSSSIRNKRGTHAACLAWHPHQQVLAVAWRDGAVSLWDARGQLLQEDAAAHTQQAVTHLVWHPSGLHLLTGDAQGSVVLWDVGGREQQQLAASWSATNQGSSITHAVWLVPGEPGAAPAPSMAVYATTLPGSGTVTLKALELQQGTSCVVQDVGESLLGLLPYGERAQLVALTSSGTALILAANSSSSDSDSSTPRARAATAATAGWSVLLRVKVASSAAAAAGLQVCWAGPHCLALASGCEAAVRLLQLDTGVLGVAQAGCLAVPSSRGAVSEQAQQGAQPLLGVTALAYQPHHQLLAAVAGTGDVCVFQHSRARDGEQQWQAVHCFQAAAGATSMAWGATADLLAVGSAQGLHVCHRTALHHKVCGGIVATQASAGRVLVQATDGSGPAATISTSLQLAGLDLTATAVLLHDGRQAEVHSISTADGSSSLLARWAAPALAPASPASGAASCCALPGCSMALHGDSVFRTAEGRVEVCSLQGVVRQTLSVSSASHGQPVLLDMQAGHLAVLTSTGMVLVYDARGPEAKAQAGPGPVLPSTAPLGRVHISGIRVNCDGSMVCALATAAGSGGSRDPRLLVYCAALNGPLCLDFSAHHAAPVAACWDAHDPRLLAVQTQPLQLAQRGSSGAGDVPAAWGDVATVFASDEAGLLLQEFQGVGCDAAGGAAGLLGVAAPNLLLLPSAAAAATRASAAGAPGSSGAAGGAGGVQRVLLRCFSGIPGGVDDAATRAALLDFNYLLAVGRPHDAFKAVARVRSKAAAQTMAQMAIKSKQLDAAAHCLGSMEHLRGARALRESAACVPELDARVGLVALQLGLPEDAACLFAGCERWDLLGQLHAASGRWDDAVKVAAAQDRVHLRVVQHAHARHCEAIGDTKGAAQHYIAAGGAATEVPRMLWEVGETAQLEEQVLTSADAQLLTWWARACEARGEYQQAINCHKRAGNQLAVLRILCATHSWEAAEQLVAATQDPAAAFHLARLHEARGDVPGALRCYGISKRIVHGARLAKRCGLDQELLSCALKSPPAMMLEAADHLLAAGNAQGAALLYQKAGRLARAVELAFAGGLVDVLDGVASQLGADADVGLLNRCAEALLAAGRHEHAVRLLVKAHQQERALDVLLAHGVPLTEELAEALTPDKAPGNADTRGAVLLRIAQAAKAQGLFHLACKKYSQAGDRLKAVRALIKSCDTDKIIFFAGVSRQREVYISAANFLQTLSWRTQPELLTHILAFYTKAGASDSLAAFFLGCAHTELLQFKAYAKALQAMHEAAKHLAKSRAADAQAQLAALQGACGRVERFVRAQQGLLGADPATAVLLCQQLLAELAQQAQQQDGVPDVQLGDVYGALVSWCCAQGNTQQALQLASQALEQHGLQPQHFLDASVLDTLQAAAGGQAFTARCAQP